MESDRRSGQPPPKTNGGAAHWLGQEFRPGKSHCRAHAKDQHTDKDLQYPGRRLEGPGNHVHDLDQQPAGHRVGQYDPDDITAPKFGDE